MRISEVVVLSTVWCSMKCNKTKNKTIMVCVCVLHVCLRNRVRFSMWWGCEGLLVNCFHSWKHQRGLSHLLTAVFCSVTPWRLVLPLFPSNFMEASPNTNHVPEVPLSPSSTAPQLLQERPRPLYSSPSISDFSFFSSYVFWSQSYLVYHLPLWYCAHFKSFLFPCQSSQSTHGVILPTSKGSHWVPMCSFGQRS